jgi:glutathione peroxidase
MFSKINVNGKDTHPLYIFLKKHAKGLLTDSIKWNFTKFLISVDGQVIKRYSPSTSPKDIIKDIEKNL